MQQWQAPPGWRRANSCYLCEYIELFAPLFLQPLISVKIQAQLKLANTMNSKRFTACTSQRFIEHSSASPTMKRRRSAYLLDSILDFDVWTSDFTKACIESSDPLMQALFINKPLPEFELDSDKCLKLLKA
eukprot:IDg8674t1